MRCQKRNWSSTCGLCSDICDPRSAFLMAAWWRSFETGRLPGTALRISAGRPRFQTKPSLSPAAGLPHRVDRGVEHVADAALGDDEARVRGVGLDLAPQAQDLHVDRAVVDLGVVQARKVEKLFAREDALRRRKESGEQAELALGELDGLALRAFQLAQPDVELPAAEAVGAHL